LTAVTAVAAIGGARIDGKHLADQLLIPMALARGGSYTTTTPTLHTTTNIETVKKFLPVEINTTQLTEDVWKVEVLG
jgi:RNA 3'-terminal phosphate cyclase (ATP)